MGKPARSASLNFHAGAFIAVVQNHFHAARHQLGVKFFSQLHRLVVRVNVQRRDANLVRRDTQRPDDAVLVVALLDDRLQRARDADAVTAHHTRLAIARLVEEQRVGIFSLYFVPSLKTWPTSIARRIFSGLAHLAQGSPAVDRPQIKPLRHLDVALDGDVAQMKTVFIGAGLHVACIAQRFIGKSLECRHSFAWL